MKNDKRMSPNKIYDVAGAAGVSLATVSRVLNHPEKVKPATRERIEKIIKELGYKPNLNAKGLASSRINYCRSSSSRTYKKFNCWNG